MSAARRVVIVGGGVVGSATAYFLARDHALRATVLERDPAYRRASSALSAGSIRQQFSSAINIRLSQASFAFLRGIDAELRVDAPVDVGFIESGYLFLATVAGAGTLRDNHRVQVANGAAVAMLTKDELGARFPWLDADGIALAALGLAGEGWFDGYALLQALRGKARALGVRYVASEATRIVEHDRRVRAVACGDARFDCDELVISAGAWSAPLALQLGFDLPVRARKRDVFVFESPARLGTCPLVIDPTGVWFRPEGRGFICGAPPRGDDVDDAPLEAIDHGLFDEVIWPLLARRVPAFEALRVVGAWAGYYEFNTFDQNGLVGRLPGCSNAFVACGFSGHGLQQAPAVGRAMAELIATGGYRTLDLALLSPQRVLDNAPLLERNVI
ncbi:MAG: NAD(P)/FAD-dependent oxidoreductase [Gemmatimonadota bacterium]